MAEKYHLDASTEKSHENQELPTNLVSDPPCVLSRVCIGDFVTSGDEFARVGCDDLLSATIAQLEDQIVILLVSPNDAGYKGDCAEYLGQTIGTSTVE